MHLLALVFTLAKLGSFASYSLAKLGSFASYSLAKLGSFVSYSLAKLEKASAHISIMNIDERPVWQQATKV